MPQQSANTQIFAPEFFDRFAPQTAFDMVVELPGFQIEGDSDGSRGFGQASGNVLINGQRISGKSNSATTVLQRITASSVVRIELLDGASLDIPGLSGQVANVIANQAGLSGTWSYEAQFRPGLEPNLRDIEVALSGRTGQVDWSVSIENNPFRGGNRGLEQVFDGAGNVIETRDEAASFTREQPQISGNLTWNRLNGDIGNLNGTLVFDFFDIRETGDQVPIDNAPNFRLFEREADSIFGEIGGDYEFDLGPGRLKLIGLVSLNDDPGVSTVTITPLDGTPATGSSFAQNNQEFESIIRSEYSWSPREGRDWQISFEGAFNSLDVVSNLSVLNDEGVFEGVELDNATSRVEEFRGETNITYGRRFSSRVSSQISAGVEVSEISQSGPAGMTRVLAFPKGFVSVSWNALPQLDITARVEREVGQLNFGDFVSSVNVNVDNDSLGNPDLLPEQTTSAEIEFEGRFGNVGAGTLRIFGERIEDVLDRIPFSETTDGVGNIGTGTQYGVEINTTVQLSRFGWEGAQLEFEGEARNSSVTDPLTGLDRRISNNLVSRVFAELRWDIPNTDYALNLFYDQDRRARNFRIDEITFNRTIPGTLGVSIEHKDIFGMLGFIQFNNLIDRRDRLTREVFEGNRFGPIDFIEDRDREVGPILRLGLSGTF